LAERLRRACRQIPQHEQAHRRSAVNNQREPLWQTDFLQPDLILQIEQILQETGLDACG